MTEANTLSLEPRIYELIKILLTQDGDGNVDLLLDLLVGLYEDCKLVKPVKGTYISNFLERCKLL
jgi:hypothetical protein